MDEGSEPYASRGLPSKRTKESSQGTPVIDETPPGVLKIAERATEDATEAEQRIVDDISAIQRRLKGLDGLLDRSQGSMTRINSRLPKEKAKPDRVLNSRDAPGSDQCTLSVNEMAPQKDTNKIVRPGTPHERGLLREGPQRAEPPLHPGRQEVQELGSTWTLGMMMRLNWKYVSTSGNQRVGTFRMYLTLMKIC